MPLHPLLPSADGERCLPPRQFTNPFCYEPHPLCVAAADEVKAYLQQHEEWADEIAGGKMFGVLVVEQPDADEGQYAYLAAFSGLLDGQNNLPFFVPPVYDLLAPDGHFQQEQACISALNAQIRDMEDRGDMDSTPFAYTRRERRSISALKDERRNRSIALQAWLFDQYVCLNARGERKTVTQIFLDYYREKMLHPEHFEENARRHHIPSGTGECCAPKLLQYAYQHGLRPLCMAEWWMGASPKEEVRYSGHFYPSCSKKCRPLLHFMLQGMDVEESFLERHNRELLSNIAVLYEDDDLMVINKPAGLLSVPGRDAQVSVIDWLHEREAEADHAARYAPAHRLDQDTSGILLIAKHADALRNLQEQFIRHKVKKQYTALLDGQPTLTSGTIDLPLRKDPNDSPRQMVDYERGKASRTRYEVVDVQRASADADAAVTRISFFPETGRTHQLRMHAAHADGLACPIVGDKLYGRQQPFFSPSNYQSLLLPRLMLHATSIRFYHPVSGEPMHIDCPCPF